MSGMGDVPVVLVDPECGSALFLTGRSAYHERAQRMRHVERVQGVEAYNPHLTLAKRTRWVSKRRETLASGLPTLPPTMPDDTTAYGDVVVEVDAVVASVELVQMRGEKEADGYYKIVASEPLSGQVWEDRQSDDAAMTG